jgi:hypothetical protein
MVKKKTRLPKKPGSFGLFAPPASKEAEIDQTRLWTPDARCGSFVLLKNTSGVPAIIIL